MSALRVDLLDPPAYSPAYDHALATALSDEGVQVRLLTSHFAYGDVPVAAGYEREERFYARARGAAGSRRRTASKLAVHVQDLRRYARGADADVVHVQWLTVPGLDLRLLPKLPTVLTIHDPLERGPLPGPAPDLDPLAAVIVHSQYARSVVAAQYALDPGKIHVVRHGALRASQEPGELPPELGGAPGSRVPVVLCFGLIRPYKGLETLLAAWEGVTGAELWIVGRPMMEITALEASAPPSVRFVPRYVSDAEEAALYTRADIAVLPYERSARFGFSGALATALGYGKATILSDVGGLAEVAAQGAARSVAPGDADALRAALRELIAEPQARRKLAHAAQAAADGPYSWQAAARATIAVYEKILR